MTRLSDCRRAADRYAADAHVRRMRLREAVHAIDQRTRRYRSAIVVGAGVIVGVVGGLLPIRKTIRLASFSFNAAMVTRRLLSVVSVDNGQDIDDPDAHGAKNMTAAQAAGKQIETQRKG